MIDRSQIKQVVINSISDFKDIYDIDIDLSKGEDTRLFGGTEGALDSLGLVSLVVKIEEDIEDQLDITITLTDERAMSRRTSPFARVKYLVDYIDELISK